MGAIEREKLPAIGYEFFDFDYGFEVVGRDRTPVRVLIEPEKFSWAVSHMRSKDSQRDHEWFRTNDDDPALPTRVLGGDVGYYRGYPLSDLYNLIKQVGNGLMQFWEAPQDKPQRGERKHWYGVDDWARKQAAKAIASRVRDRWRWLIERHYPPEFVAGMRRIFSVTFRHPQEYHLQLLATMRQDDPLLYSDIMQYRAAAFAFMIGFERDWNDLGYRRETHNVTSDNWMEVFGEPTRSKRRTLMNLPHGCSISALSSFRNLELRQPLTTRIGINWAGSFAFTSPFDASQFKVTYASDKQIIAASEGWTDKSSPRSASTHFKLAGFISDMLRDMNNRQVGQEMQRRSLVAMRDRAVTWHRRLYQRDMKRDMKELRFAEDDPTARPPVPLPKPEGRETIRFLDTAKAVYDEAEDMHHCVYLYVTDAIAGHVFLFHVELDGERATVAVNENGLMLQSYGPCNQINKASRRGARVLDAWGGTFPNSPYNLPSIDEMVEEQEARAVGHGPAAEAYNVLPAYVGEIP